MRWRRGRRVMLVALRWDGHVMMVVVVQVSVHPSAVPIVHHGTLVGGRGVGGGAHDGAGLGRLAVAAGAAEPGGQARAHHVGCGGPSAVGLVL